MVNSGLFSTADSRIRCTYAALCSRNTLSIVSKMISPVFFSFSSFREKENIIPQHLQMIGTIAIEFAGC